jgi:membrane protein DedA with SNARE-associated domain
LRPIIDFIVQSNPLVIYMVVALTLCLESSGIPVANTTLLLLTGAMTTFGHLNLWILMFVAILGSVTGACSAYGIGAHGGRPAFLRLATFFHVDEQKVNLTERWFQKSGLWMLLLSRILPYIRPFACFFGGITNMPFQRFFVAALAGSTIWCIAIVQIGAMLGPHWKLALILIRNYTLPTSAALLLLIVLYILVRMGLNRALQRTAQPNGVAEEITNENVQNDPIQV